MPKKVIYKEIMDRVQVTDEMRSRILHTLKMDETDTVTQSNKMQNVKKTRKNLYKSKEN